MVEYALLMALFVVPTISAISYLQDVSKTKIEHTADGISRREAPGDDGG